MEPNNQPSASSVSEPIELNETQAAALNAIKEFLDSADKIFILNGAAGTGKTTLVNQLCKTLSQQKIRYELAATTGRAAKVLSAKANIQAKTLHSLLYVFDEISGNAAEGQDPWTSDTGQLFLNFGVRNAEVDIHPNVFIVDEASMISHLPAMEGHTARFGSGILLNDLLQYAGTSQIIFVGDACQLPPVADESFSAALSTQYWQQRNIKSRYFTLTQIVRQQQHNEILQVAGVFRKAIEQNSREKLIALPLPQNKNVFATLGQQKFLEAYHKAVKKNGITNTVVTCFGNKVVSTLNNLIRRQLHNKAELQVGDMLLVVQNSYSTNLVNGAQVIVTEVQPYMPRAGFNFLKVKVKSVFDNEEFETLLIADLLYNDVPHLTNDEVKRLLIDFDHRMKNLGIKRNSTAYKDKMRTDEYLNALRAKFGYAITIHKAQGGEWNVVFLFLDSTIYSQVYSRSGADRHPDGADRFHRWFYTAITRAKEYLVVNDCPMVKNFSYRYPEENKAYWKQMQKVKEKAKTSLQYYPAGTVQGVVSAILHFNEDGTNGFIKTPATTEKVYFIISSKNPLHGKIKEGTKLQFVILPPKANKGIKATNIRLI